MIEVMSALTCQLAGVDPTNPKQSCLGIDQKSGRIGFLPSPQTGGAIGFMGNMIAALYTPPLHTSDYFRDLASNFGINKKAYAQNAGVGFQGLTPLINIWSAFRNIVYLFLVIVFIVIGLAIMLRVKIDPRTVMSIQNQIPKIIIGILVVTFSFAIAGFLIDLMWVFIYLVYGIFTGITGVDVNNLNPATFQGQSALGVAGHIRTGGIFGIANNVAMDSRGLMKDLLGIGISPLSGILDIFGAITRLHAPGTGEIVPDFLIDAISVGAGLFAGAHTAQILNNNIVSFFTGGANITATGVAITTFSLMESTLRFIIPYGIVFLVVLIALFFALFRLWFTLLMAYVYILLDVVLAPFWIIGGIVPGSPISFSGWIRDIGANLLAFPATIAMFMLGKVFMDSFGKPSASGTQNFVPPLIGNPGDTSLIGSLIGLGVILMTPNIVNLLKTALKAPKIDTGGIAKGLGVGVGLPLSTIKGAAGLKQASEEFIVKGYDERSGKVEYGQRGIGRGLLGRFGR